MTLRGSIENDDGQAHEAAHPIERRFLVGPDIVTSEAIILATSAIPGRTMTTEVPVRVGPAHVFNFSKPHTISDLEVNGRSRIAVSGAAPTTPNVYAWMKSEQILALSQGNEVDAMIPFTNYSTRTIRLPQGTAVAQLYQRGSRKLKGVALEDAIRQKRIIIEEPWHWVDGDESLGKKIAIQIPLDPNPERICWFPPSETGEPTEIRMESYEAFRASLQGRLIPISRVAPAHRFLAIRWTQHPIHIPDPRTIGSLSSLVVGHEKLGDQPDVYASQIYSLLMHPGRPNHQIITEQFVNPQYPYPNSVALSFWDMG